MTRRTWALIAWTVAVTIAVWTLLFLGALWFIR